mgnify:CR=1 FL=1
MCLIWFFISFTSDKSYDKLIYMKNLAGICFAYCANIISRGGRFDDAVLGRSGYTLTGDLF